MTTSAIIAFPATITLADADPIDDAFEQENGLEMLAQLEALPQVKRAWDNDADHAIEALRETYPEYTGVPADAERRPEVLAGLRALFPDVDATELDRLIALIRYAVHVEMKHWNNDSFVIALDYGHELLISPDNYDSDDELVDYGNDQNREKWQDLTNLAAHRACALQAETAHTAPLAA
ncbi:hypothetical protein V6N00_12770 [Tersicoccus sp. MR15.9]|uniref:hypothetical protein n=1 Tax=Tersicoccus mangrovi TaxID=3121635 RepID=UPI002FE6052D